MRVTWPMVVGLVFSFWVHPAHAGSRIDVGFPLTDSEVNAIEAMSVPDLANVVRTGTPAQKAVAVRTLVAREQGALLLTLAKEGSQATNGVLIRFFTPKATEQGKSEDRQLVDDYLTFLEGELRSGNPTVEPKLAVGGIAQVAAWIARYHLQEGAPPSLPYGYHRVVDDLIWLLKDPRFLVSEEAATWLGHVGGCAIDEGRKAMDALREYKQRLVATQKPGDELNRRLGWVDLSIQGVQVALDDRARGTSATPMTFERTTGTEPTPNKDPNNDSVISKKPDTEKTRLSCGSPEWYLWIGTGASIAVLAVGVWLIVGSYRKSPKPPTTQV